MSLRATKWRRNLLINGQHSSTGFTRLSEIAPKHTVRDASPMGGVIGFSPSAP